MTHHNSARRQRGLSLMGLMFWAVVIAFVGTVVIKVVPTVQEYIAIRNTVRRITDGSNPSAADIRAAFEKQRIIEYGINAVSGRDLQIETSGDKLVVRFAYDKEIEIFDPVYLLIKYQGSSATR
jgi:hypothetical protein